MVKLILWTAAIVAVLMAVSGDRPPKPEVKHMAAGKQIVYFLAALDLYRSDVGGFPSEAEGLRALRVNPGPHIIYRAASPSR
jgi:hypothetical protein